LDKHTATAAYFRYVRTVRYVEVREKQSDLFEDWPAICHQKLTLLVLEAAFGHVEVFSINQSEFLPLPNLNSMEWMSRVKTRAFYAVYSSILVRFSLKSFCLTHLVMATLAKRKRTKASIMVFSSISKRSEHLR